MTVTVGKRRSDSTTPSPRVLTAADAAGLGEWERSDAPNADNGSGTGWFVAAAGVPLIAAWFVIPALYFGSGAVNDNPWGWALVISGALAAVVTVAVCGVCLVVGVDHTRRGPLRVHQFAHGFVLDRVKGRAAGYRYDETSADLIVYENFSDDPQHRWDEREVLLSMSDGSSAVILRSREPAFATRLATRCRPNPGTMPRPRRLGVDGAVAIEQAHIWE